MNKRTIPLSKPLFYILLGGSLFWPAPASAVHAAETSAAQQEYVLEGVAVTANRERPADLPPAYAGGQVARGGRLGVLGNRDFMDTPFNVTSYTAELMENQQAANIAEVVANHPSVRLTSSGSYNQFWNIRGFSVTAVSFNGLYNVSPHWLSGSDFVERVEVLTGPSALLNGVAAASGNIGGAINLVPKRAGEEPLTKFTASYSGDSQLGGHIDIGRRFGENQQFGLRFNGSYRSGATAFDNESLTTGAASLGLDWRSERWRTSLDLGYQNRKIDAPTTYFYGPTAFSIPKTPPNNTMNISPAWTYADTKSIFGALHSEFDLNKAWTIFASAGGRRSTADYLFTGGDFTSNQGDFITEVYNFPMKNNAHTEELGIRGRFATGSLQHHLTLSGTRSQIDSYSLSEKITEFPSGLYHPGISQPVFSSWGRIPKNSTTTLSGLALTDTLSTRDGRLQLILGARRQQMKVDKFNSQTGAKTSGYNKSAVTPGLGIVLKAKDHLSVYGNYIQALQQGPTASSNAVNAGEVFSPYKAKQYEVGVKLDSGVYGATLSAFQIEQPSGQVDPVTRIYGLDGEQRNRGLELNVFGEPVKGTRLLGGFMLLDGKLVRTANGANDGNTAAGASRWTATLGVEWDTPFQPDLTITARAVYNGSQYLDNANTQKIAPWTRLDVGARYSFQHNSTPITIRATVANALNKRYWQGISGGLTIGQGRTLLLSATMEL